MKDSMKDSMKEWWINLSLREKQIVSLGGAAVILFLLYLIIWSPLLNKNEHLRSQIKQDRTLLNWMQEAEQRMQTVTKSPHPQKVATTASVLGVVQHQVNQSPFAKQLGQLRQTEGNAVQITFPKVAFDQLIEWLTQLGEQNDIIVAQIAVKPSETPGVVAADIVLKAAG